MRDSYQGYFFGVKEVLKAAEHKELSNIHGVVLDLIDIPKAYITAIDTVLGGQAQNIVVQNDIAARNAINWLKRSEEHTSELQSRGHLVCRLLLEKKNRRRLVVDH